MTNRNILPEPALIKYFESIRDQLIGFGLKVDITYQGFVVSLGDNRLFICKSIEGLAGFAEGFKSRLADD